MGRSRAPDSVGRRAWRTWIALTALAALLTVALVARAVWMDSVAAADTDSDEVKRPTIHAVEVQVEDLVATKTVSGELAFGEGRTVTAPADGTVTSIAAGDQRVRRGDTLFAIDAVPSVVIFGDTAMHRRLEPGVSDGHDVQVVESNLAALGFAAQHDMVVDNHFDKTTERAVKDFEASVGAPIDGRLDPGQVTVLDGPAIVDSTDVQLGAQVQPGSPMMEVTATERVTSVAFADDGVVTGLPTVGSTLVAGDVAFQLGDARLGVIVGDLPPARTLSREKAAGPDVVQLERNLDRLGITDDGVLDVDAAFDAHTQAAWRIWERWFGQPIDGRADVGDYVVVPANAQVSNVAAVDHAEVQRGEVAFELSRANRVVTAKIDAADDGLLHVGDAVTVEFPNDTTADGTITGIDASTTTNDYDGSTTTGFEVAVVELPDQFAERYRVEVKVNVVSEVATGSVVVPASALISTGNGTYAVEVVDGTGTKFVAVDPGLFADGNVAVNGIEPGTAVVVPES